MSIRSITKGIWIYEEAIICTGGGGLLLTLLIISGVVSYLESKTLVLDDVSLREVMEDDSLAIYVDDGTAGDDNDDKNYVEYDGDTFPAKADGYKYNADKTTCIDNNGNVTTEVTLYYNNDMIQISTSETVYCYIYFDLYTSNGDWCLANDITDNLGECAIVMDNYYNDVDSAKTAIEAKDPVDTSEIAPDITYNQVVNENESVSLSTSNYWIVGTGISFDKEAGYFTLENTTNTTDTTSYIYNGYYTCATTGASCVTVYKINEYIVTVGTSSTTYKITEADIYTYSAGETIDSTNGIYAAEDDVDTSYYYRGSVQNNYVLFAGYYWRIVRINGDGSVRLIYQGETADATGTDAQIGTAQFNTITSDPTYVGYMYGITSSTPVTQDSTTNFTNFSASTTYSFGTSYEETGSGTFKLSGTIISGTFSGLFGSGGTYAEDIANYYTCFSTSSTGTCTLLMKLNAYNSSASANVYYISYASTSYEDTLANSHSSNIKIVLEDWYKEKIYQVEDGNGNYWSDYVSASATFCGDRSLYSTFTGAGYILTTTTYYNARNRLVTLYNPTLKCSQTSDLYSVDNGTLTYPIGLIATDEIVFAGGKNNNANTLYYLNTGSTYWTMTPSYFNPSLGYAHVWFVNSAGSLGYDKVGSFRGVRPVINLSANVKISSGTGTASNPFRVTLD